jgi:hypothetical protein
VSFGRFSIAGAWVCLAVAGWLATPAARAALEEKIDPTKRAPVSTSGAVQPAARPMKSSAFTNARIIRMNDIPLQPAAVQDRRANVVVTEGRSKTIISPARREVTVVQSDAPRHHASERPASIPRLDRERFERMLDDYSEGRIPANTLLNTAITQDGARVSLGDINRFASPRAALEAQGIPVIQAGGGEPAGDGGAATPADGTPVAIPETKNPAPR